MRETFTKKDRILKSAEFRRILRHGKRFGMADVTVVASRGREGRTRVGLTVSRKVGNAVVRNRVKRRLREIVRRDRKQLEFDWDIVLIAHPGSGNTPYRVLERQLLEAFASVERRGRARRKKRRHGGRRSVAPGDSPKVSGK